MNDEQLPDSRNPASPTTTDSSDDAPDIPFRKAGQTAFYDTTKDYQCICGGKNYPDWIMCDNTNCPIEWYHQVCLNLTETPVGRWLCPRCRPSMIRPVPIQPTPEIPNFPNLAKTKFSAPKVEESSPPKKGVATKKGTAVKKTAPPRPKPRWKGWAEVSSDEEVQYKKKVEESWEETTIAERTRKAKGEIAQTPKRRRPQLQQEASPVQATTRRDGRPTQGQMALKKTKSSRLMGNDDREEIAETPRRRENDTGAGASLGAVDRAEMDLSPYGGAVAWRS